MKVESHYFSIRRITLSNYPTNSLSAYQVWEPASLELPLAAELSPDSEQLEQLALDDQAIELEKSTAREAGFQQGYQDGLVKGLEQGLAQGLQEGQKQAHDESRAVFLEQKRQIQSLITHFESDLDMARESVASDILKLSLELAKAMLKTSLQIKPELIVDLVQHILNTLPTVQPPAFIVLHPSDAHLINKHIGNELSESGWRIIEDASIEPGGCKIETSTNEVDASLTNRWQYLVDALNQNTNWLT